MEKESYLTHQLVRHIFPNYKGYNDFKCNICGIYLCKIRGKFYVLKNDGSEPVGDAQQCLLTCDEVIIKNIIG